jgi:hypothetical protein
VNYRVVTTDYADNGTSIVEYHDVEGAFEDARRDAEKHVVVSVYRYTSGEPDLLWSTRAE